MKMTDKRLAKLDETLSFYSCMRKTEDAVIIKMSKDILVELIAVNHPFVTYSTDLYHPHQYKGNYLELVPAFDYVAVAYFNTKTFKTHNIREIKEADT